MSTHTPPGQKELAGLAAYTSDGLDRDGLALRNLALMQNRAVPVSVITQQLGKTLAICDNCGALKATRRSRACSRRCSTALAARTRLVRRRWSHPVPG
jgi:hypothetical protein